jgi:hypothetical protein
MNIRYIKILTIALALVFAIQGCAIFVRDKDRHYRYRHHRDRDWHSSVEQPTQPVVQVTQSKY